jgi:glycosyltransferase involved in cell wall biosynthesis
VYIANSEEVKRRIQKFYRRESEVVYPPVVVPEILSVHSMPPTKSDYYLMVTRVVGSKNIDLAVRTARKYGFRLVIAGRRINKDIDLTGVEYVGEVSEEKKVELIRGSLGVLCLEEYADFGITAVEPQIYGVPVIAYKGGGYLESVIDGRTGVFFDQMTEESLHGAIIKSKDLVIDDEDIKGVAKRFSKDEFKSGIKRVLKRYE